MSKTCHRAWMGRRMEEFNMKDLCTFKINYSVLLDKQLIWMIFGQSGGLRHLDLTILICGSFLPTATWLGEDPLVSWVVFAGVRLPCGRNVEKKFLEGVVAVLTARWLVTKSLNRKNTKERKDKVIGFTKKKLRYNLLTRLICDTYKQSRMKNNTSILFLFFSKNLNITGFKPLNICVILMSSKYAQRKL